MSPVPWLPASPNTPTRPYWRAGGALAEQPWPAAIFDGSTVSLSLVGATYNPVGKTCTVACHSVDPVWGRQQAYNCQGCHP
jgi:hypothetical protein